LRIDSHGLIIANVCDNRRLILLRFDNDQLVSLGDLVSIDIDLPKTFHPRRVCLGGEGLVYVGSGSFAADHGVPVETRQRTVGSVTLWNIQAQPQHSIAVNGIPMNAAVGYSIHP